jgi:hypothetical protein
MLTQEEHPGPTLNGGIKSMLPVKDGKPETMRFDFMVRYRPATLEEIAKAKEAGLDYPQHRDVLRALRGISRKDGHNSTERWRELLGIAKDEGK